MTPDDFLDFQKRVESNLSAELGSLNSRTCEADCVAMDVAGIQGQRESIQELFSDSGKLQRLEECPLLNNAAILPYEVPVNDLFAYAMAIFREIRGYLNSDLNWDDYFRARAESVSDIWGASARWKAVLQEQHRVAKEAERMAKEAERVAQERRENDARRNLEVTKTRFSKPQQEAPCLATRRKNGLNCNRNTLVLLAKLPLIASPGKEVEILVYRCSECWQLYKEICERDLSTKHIRDCFLKPGEIDPVLGLSFSSAESEGYGKVDFASILCPILKDDVGENARG